MSANHASLDAAATERKARLAKLASLKRKQPDSDPSATNADPSQPPDQSSTKGANSTDIYLSGRNYDVTTRGPKLGFETEPSADQDTIEDRAAAISLQTAEQAREDEAAAEKGIDLFKLQPKKANWDLKRDLDQKLKVLDVRTKNAIAKLVRERIQQAKETEVSKGRVEKGSTDTEGENVGMEGNTLVEGVHLREREEQEDERREKEMEEEEAIV